MTILKSFKHKGNLVEQIYLGAQNIAYRVNGKVFNTDNFIKKFGLPTCMNIRSKNYGKG